MSKIGKQLVTVPADVTVTTDDGVMTVKGPRGTLSRPIHPLIAITATPEGLSVSTQSATKAARALWGTTRAHLQNMITGVTAGFTKQLELQGVGYRAKLKGKDLEMSLGYSHTITVPAPEGITFTVEKEIVTVAGTNVEHVGQIAADIRELRKPEPYKGKGVRYVGEKVRRKEGKVVGSGPE